MYQRFYFKHVFGYLLSILIIMLLLIPCLIIAFCIKIDSKGPIFFKQIRIGKNMKPFYIYKFRTMTHDVDRKGNHELIGLNEADGPVFKVKNDPRLTKVGNFIRKYSLDEIPQFWNVFKLDMTLVGPRPLPDYEVEEIQSDFKFRRHIILPGITGLWQTTERNKISTFAKWVELDLDYIENCTFLLDLKIIAKTILILLGGKSH